MIRILLADDHAIIRTGLKISIKNLIEHTMIEEAWDNDSAFEKIQQNEYDLAILDVNMPGTDSFSLVRNMIALKPDLKILMFSMNAEEVYAKKYLQLGVKGYLSKDASQTEIKNAIQAVLNNERYISSDLRLAFIEEALGNKASNPFNNLSPREFEIVQHFIRGESSADVCTKLNLRSSTMSTHKTRIFEKLNCKNIIDLNLLAKVHKVISY